ncbi:TIGR03617 family F420-dependent LLM class oxidoreductase [Kallotenue papyrolyticum]|uniref:TIGR03617 family F420-dependent LLM class oxidoreductase n=1 Tax=Kallotenue papyrolyticum TaxID=1325125 RepID=UPI000492B005|nr:TIGR03617 family F420-dependent LLM class oxidoreductase [Kallotenue papyrolyticum]
MQLDVGLPVEGDHLATIREVARAAEALGFAGLWTSETKHDAFLPLVLAAEHTQRLALGTAVAIAFGRSPMVTAQIAWDLQRFSNGRLLLGLGTQVKAHIERRFSMPWDAPVARLRDYIQALRAIWHSFQNDAPLEYRGPYYQHTLLTPFFNPGPIEHPQIPIYIAGVNTGLARLAGELCQGFHVHPFHSPQYVREVVLPAIQAGAAAQGRAAAAVTLAASVFVITGRTAEQRHAQREAIRRQIAFYASTPSYRVVLEVHGWAEAGERLSRLAATKRWGEMPALITDEMLAAYAVEGEPDAIGALVRQRYQGLIERVAFYLPFTPGVDDAFWRGVIDALRD